MLSEPSPKNEHVGGQSRKNSVRRGSLQRTSISKLLKRIPSAPDLTEEFELTLGYFCEAR